LLLIPIRFDSSCTRGLAGSPDRADSRVGVTETVPLRGPRARTGRVRTGTSYISFSVIPAGDRGKSGWLSGRSVPQPRRVRTRCLTHRGQQRPAATHHARTRHRCVRRRIASEYPTRPLSKPQARPGAAGGPHRNSSRSRRRAVSAIPIAAITRKYKTCNNKSHETIPRHRPRINSMPW